MRKMIIISYGFITLTSSITYVVLDKNSNTAQLNSPTPEPDFLYNCL